MCPFANYDELARISDRCSSYIIIICQYRNLFLNVVYMKFTL